MPNAVDAVFTPDGPRAEGDYVLAVGTLEPRKNLARTIEATARGSASSCGSSARRGWGGVERARRQRRLARRGLRRGARAPVPWRALRRRTRRCTKASGSRCSRRWRAARPSSRRAAARRRRSPAARRCSSTRSTSTSIADGIEEAIGAATSCARSGSSVRAPSRGTRPRGGPSPSTRGGRVSDPLVVIDADVLGRQRTGDETYVESCCVRCRPSATGSASPRSRAALTSCRRASSRSSCRRGARSSAWPCACRCSCAGCGPRSRTSCTRCRSRCPCPAVLTVQDLSFERDASLMGRRETAIFRLVVPRSARRARAGARDLAADEGRPRRALRPRRRRRSS